MIIWAIQKDKNLAHLSGIQQLIYSDKIKQNKSGKRCLLKMLFKPQNIGLKVEK